MTGGATEKVYRDLGIDAITPEALRDMCMELQPETDMVTWLWPSLSDWGQRWFLSHLQVGDFYCGIEIALRDAVEQGVVAPQWLIDASAEFTEHWGWSPNVEKACAALQARLDSASA